MLLRSLLSDDLPKSRWLSFVLLAILIGLAVAPFAFPGAKSLNVAARICVFIVLAAVGGVVLIFHVLFHDEPS